MLNLRARAERDLGRSLEGRFALPVVLIGPDGIRYDRTVDGRPLCGQVLFNIVREGEAQGMVGPITVNTPTVALRRSSLPRCPVEGETWIVMIPESPLVGAPLVQYVFSATRPPEGGASIGFIRLYLQHVEQVPAP